MSRTILNEAIRLIDGRKPFVLCTVVDAKGSVPGKIGAKMIVFPDGSQSGTVGGAGLEEKVKKLALEALKTGRSATVPFDLAYYREGALDSLCGGRVQIFIEAMRPTPHVLLCGGGHVGREVAKVCDQLGYFYSVLDDRSEFAHRERFPAARECHVSLPEPFFSKADLSQYSHILILGYSHRIDTDILYEACRRFDGSIGLIASKMKKREMFHRVKARGITEEQLKKIEAPVGLPIGAESPAEVAIAIMAGVIQSVKGVTEEPSEGETNRVEEAVE